MRNEQFDKKISEKLNEIEPIFREADWSRLNAKLRPELTTAPAPNAFVRYAKPFAVAAAAVVGILAYQNVVQQKENEQIRLEIAQLKQRVEAAKTSATPIQNSNENQPISQNSDGQPIAKNEISLTENTPKVGAKKVQNTPPPVCRAVRRQNRRI